MQVEKYENGTFGSCPRVYCAGCNVVPCGRSDMPGLDTVKLFCPNCNDMYVPPSSKFQGVDGKCTLKHHMFLLMNGLRSRGFLWDNIRASVLS